LIAADGRLQKLAAILPPSIPAYERQIFANGGLLAAARAIPRSL
jgi:hypothetical protein